MDEGGRQHGGLRQRGGPHNLGPLGQQGCNPFTLPTIAPTIATRNTINLKNIFNIESIITRLNWKVKVG